MHCTAIDIYVTVMPEWNVFVCDSCKVQWIICLSDKGNKLTDGTFTNIETMKFAALLKY